MKFIFLYLIFVAGLIEGTLFFVPYGPYDLTNPYRFYAPECTPDDQLNQYQLTSRYLLKQGIEWKLSKLSEISTSEPNDFNQTTCYFFSSLSYWIGEDWLEKIKCIPLEKKMILMGEPPTVMPSMYNPDFLENFGKALTWDDTLVDNKKFFKIHYSSLKPMKTQLVPFNERKFLVQVSSNLKSDHPKELYSERLKAIRYFEEHPEFSFDFYGRYWEGSQYRNYKGMISGGFPEKIEVIKQYRFNLCYENMCDVQGYVTEKIFDSFAAGCVPIYYGASNITQYVPADCFIDWRQFESYDELMQYLLSITEEEFQAYLTHIRTFLGSEEAKKFSKKAWMESFFKAFNHQGSTDSAHNFKETPDFSRG